MTNDEMARRVTQVATTLKERGQETEYSLKRLGEFTSLLYDGVEQVVAAFRENGIKELNPPERRKLSNGQEQLRLDFADYQFILTPDSVDAYLDTNDPAFKDQSAKTLSSMKAARLSVLLRPNDHVSPAAFYGAFYIFRDSSFCTSKLGSSFSRRTSFDPSIAMDFAFTLVNELLTGGTAYWQEPDSVACENIPENAQRPRFGFHPVRKE
jgi:hypothetical protein